MRESSMVRYWTVCVGVLIAAVLCHEVELCVAGESATTRPAPDRPMSVQASLDQIMEEYRRVHRSRNDQHYQRAEAMFRAALVRAGGHPTRGLVREIVLDLAGQAVIWDAYTKANVSAGNFPVTMMYRIYWRLTPRDLSEKDAALLNKQREALYRIMASLPGRLTKEFGVPRELEGKVGALCRNAMAHYESALASPFLRPCHTPMSEDKFNELKDVMEKEILRLGKALSEKLAADVAKWRRDVAARGGADKPLPKDFGAVLLERQLRTCSGFLTFFHGMAMRKYFMPRFADLTKRKEVFLLGLPDTYGVHYNLTTGFLFWAFPN